MKAKEIRSLTVDEIESKLVEFKEKLFKQKIQKSLGQSDNPYKIKSSKKEIARLITILAEKRAKNGEKNRKEKKG